MLTSPHAVLQKPAAKKAAKPDGEKKAVVKKKPAADKPAKAKVVKAKVAKSPAKAKAAKVRTSWIHATACSLKIPSLAGLVNVSGAAYVTLALPVNPQRCSCTRERCRRGIVRRTQRRWPPITVAASVN